MNIAPQLIYNVGILFVMMIPGIILKRAGLCSETFGKGISNLVLYIAQPALVFAAYLRDFDSRVLINSLYVLLFSIVAHVVFALGAKMFFKKVPDGKQRMLRLATVFSNAAFMGIPLIASIFGDEATIYASIYNITFNAFLWSLGVHICVDEKDVNGDGVSDEEMLKKKGGVKLLNVIFHPVNVAAMLGLVFFLTPLSKYTPSFAVDALSMLKSLVAPLSMVVIGLRIMDIDFRTAFSDKHMYVFLALRHLILPFIVWGFMRLFVLVGINLSKEVIAVVLIMASTPAAASTTMLAEKYDCDAVYVSKLVTVSTVLSLLTMPLLSLLINV